MTAKNKEVTGEVIVEEQTVGEVVEVKPQEKRAAVDYRIDKSKTVDVVVYVAFDGRVTDVLSEEVYLNTVNMVQKATEQRNRLVPIIEAGDEIDEEILDMPMTKFPIDKYLKETASFCPADFELDNAIISAGTLYNPISGHYYDNGAIREAKIRYLLQSWSIGIDLRHVVLYNVRQLSPKTMTEVNKLATSIIGVMLAEYDKAIYNIQGE